jgi:hypothetical protein
MEDLSKQINSEGSQYVELPETKLKKSKKKAKKTLVQLKEEFVEDLAPAVENDEVINDDPLEDLEEANGQTEEESEEPNLDELEYTDGKERDEVDLIEDQEKLIGTDIISPFGTADMRVFERKLESMSREKMGQIAYRVAARVYSDSVRQKNELKTAFREWCSKNQVFQTDASKKAEKGALSAAFEGAESVKDLEEKLKSKSLSDLQATAAQLGYKPGFDRNKLITLIKQEYQRQN